MTSNPDSILPPSVLIPAGSDVHDHLVSLCKNRLKTRIQDVSRPERDRYWRRLRAELEIWKELEVSVVALVINEIAEHARKQGCMIEVVGIGASSMVAYALGLSSTDPVEAGLLSERFFSSRFAVLPHFVLNVSKRGYGAVLIYMKEQFGEDCVCQLRVGKEVTSWNDHFLIAGSSLGSRIAPVYIELHGIPFPSFHSTVDPNLAAIPFSMYVDGAIEVLEANCVADNALPVLGTGSAELDAEVIDRLLVSHNGLFHDTEREYAQSVLRAISPVTFDDLCVATAIGMREPSVSLNGLLVQYLQMRNDGPQMRNDGPPWWWCDHIKSATHAAAALKRHTKATGGILIFEEQLIGILRDVGRFDASEADLIRREIRRWHRRPKHREKWHLRRSEVRFAVGFEESNADLMDGLILWDNLVKYSEVLLSRAGAWAVARNRYLAASVG